MNSKEQELKNKISELEEQIQNFVPRRRVRRVYKMLGDILDAGVDTTSYVTTLIEFINKIEKEGSAIAGPEVKTAIEHLLSVRER